MCEKIRPGFNSLGHGKAPVTQRLILIKRSMGPGTSEWDSLKKP